MGKTLLGKDEEIHESLPYLYGGACFMCRLEHDGFSKNQFGMPIIVESVSSLHGSPSILMM